ncbi:calcium:proton antiporter [Aquamicrobium soli]|jgi:Ca2+:H+ antiporter|uniref:Calcium:proton antiporter n=1 Tax=Aquamicrobium soli TaxID=1811518 RepID=A0ABV7K604_9HYPH
MAGSQSGLIQIARREAVLAPVIGVGLLAFVFKAQVFALGAMAGLVVAVLLIVAVVCVSVRVAHHGEVLAAKVGDPYGTMILTLSAVLVEVVILLTIMREASSPTLARDTIFSAVMLDINGILGISALLGGWKFGEQPYNDDSGKTYGAMIMTAMGISMVVPEFVPHAQWHAYSIFTILAMMMLYWVFLRNQIGVHSYFFNYSYSDKKRATDKKPADEPFLPSLIFLIGGIGVVGLLAEVMSGFMSVGLQAISAPLGVAALIVATMSAAPEILTALRAALVNRMQVVINIALGASLSTVILTVPVIEAVALLSDRPVNMAMTPVQTVLAAITLVVAAVNLNDGETNAIEGMTHFVLFATFLMITLLGAAGG